MPELPEVETTRQGISPHIQGRKVTDVIIRQHQLRWPIDAQLPGYIQHKKLLHIDRRGKYLLLAFKHGHLLIHLGMSGSLRIVNPKQQPAQKHDHVDIIFSGQYGLRFHDPRRFGSIVWTNEDPLTHKLLVKLGPEPLSDEFSADYLFAASRKRKKEVKTLIMDSHMVVGVGNIYANESLFSAGIRPTKVAAKLTHKQCELWVKEIKRILQRSITQGGTTLRDFVGGDGKPGYFSQQLNVYGRAGKPCVNCNKPLKEIRQAQRTTVYCIQCQK
ncbi:DNA-formamidopyrimidine glycosylase [Candidatus Endobugula sertula]|uniref:Formamidopyrimidine-DNA glycosylase n=1 Tax=Candidatus Endobugula sertula TaxID=62101 RepID=A0A1D2QLD5_9GAMM|nr:DNA-formamidopyrimidine glycosylase [Candidatus Endobugula sertula]